MGNPPFDPLLELTRIEATYNANYEYFVGAPEFQPLRKVLGFTDNELNAFGTVFAAEMPATMTCADYLTTLAWAVRAYSQFQDILDFQLVGPLPETSQPKELLEHEFGGRYHCYYESLVYLREVCLALVNGNSLAATTLIRPFLELSVLAIYWRIKVLTEGIERYEKWLLTGQHKPPYKNAVNIVCDDLEKRHPVAAPQIAAIRELLISNFSATSSYNHTPTTNQSFGFRTGGLGPPELENFMFAVHAVNFTLRYIVTLYALHFPLILFPVDTYRKFGCFGPVGIYVERCNSSIVVQYLGESTVDYIREAVRDSDEVRAPLKYALERRDFTDEEIFATWNQGPSSRSLKSPSTIQELIALHMAQQRATGWVLNYLRARYTSADLSDAEKSIYDKLYGRESH